MRETHGDPKNLDLLNVMLKNTWKNILEIWVFHFGIRKIWAEISALQVRSGGICQSATAHLGRHVTELFLGTGAISAHVDVILPSRNPTVCYGKWVKFKRLIFQLAKC